MGLTDCEKIPSPDKKPPVTIDLSEFAEGVTISFREPSMADLMPPTKAVRDIQIAFPEFPEEMVRPIVLLGKCYVRDANDPPEMAPARLIAQMARDKPKVFVRIISEFSDAFPDAFGGFDPKAGND